MIEKLMLTDLSRFKIKSVILSDSFVSFYYVRNLKNKLDKNKKKQILQALSDLTKLSWGDFGEDFISNHVMTSDFLVLAVTGGNLIGYGAISYKSFLNKRYYYFEFLIIHPGYQKIGLSKHMIKILFNKIFIHNFLRFNFFINLITITPNPVIVGIISRRSAFMYPDPNFFINNTIKSADDKIWLTAYDVIKNSYNPYRKLSRIGLVLHNSYNQTPWLIHPESMVQWDLDENVNAFCKYYLQYSKQLGKEFVIIAKFKPF